MATLDDYLTPDTARNKDHSNYYDGERFLHSKSYSCPDEAANAGLTEEAVSHIYHELESIRKQVKEENAKLSIRETHIMKREKQVVEVERLLRDAYETLVQYTEEEMFLKWQKFQEEASEASQRLDKTMKERERENKRLKDSFETIRQQNESLKKHVTYLQQKNVHLEGQISQIQGRLTNLQRLQKKVDKESQSCQPPSVLQHPSLHSEQKQATSSGRKAGHQLKAHTHHTSSGRKAGHQLKAHTHHCVPAPASLVNLENVGLLLEWITTLKGHTTGSKHQCDTPTKVMPYITEILSEVSSREDFTLQRQYLEFTRWCLLDQQLKVSVSSEQKPSALSSTMRRLGALMLGMKHVSGTSGTEKKVTVEGYCNSQDRQVRLLASLIALKTVSQADILAQVFDVLHQDLANEFSKVLFLKYCGVEVLQSLLKPTKQACNKAIDIFLLMSVESASLHSFLLALCDPNWFRAVYSILKHPQTDVMCVEKLCVILQRLSKLHESHKLFESHHLVSILRDLQVTFRGSSQSFLSLNLQSILNNVRKQDL